MKLESMMLRVLGSGFVVALLGLGMLQAQLGKQIGLLDPNTATLTELAKLPHFDEKKAKALIKERPFLAMKQLNDHLSNSLDANQLKEVYEKLFLHLNLNSASEEAIRLIPGVGRRLAHEFEEYRPYQSLMQFRREIGKYVNEDEVARLEQYVFIPINLNRASDNDLRSIPGMGRRMLHEFKEYRPYKNMKQFRKEIGKYVDENEIARFERYVTLE